MPYDNLIQRGDVAARVGKRTASRSRPTPPVKGRPIQTKLETPIPRPGNRGKRS